MQTKLELLFVLLLRYGYVFFQGCLANNWGRLLMCFADKPSFSVVFLNLTRSTVGWFGHVATSEDKWSRLREYHLFVNTLPWA